MDHLTGDDLPVDPDVTPGDRSPVAAPQPTEPVTARRRAGPPPWDVVAVIAAGGAVGGAARWAVNELLHTPSGGFPWATFTENVSGSLLLGVLLVFLLDVWRPRRYTRPFWGVGVLGGYTTFSTYTADAAALLRDGQGPLALAYLFGTLAAGLAAAWAGITLVRVTVVRPRTHAAASRRRST